MALGLGRVPTLRHDTATHTAASADTANISLRPRARGLPHGSHTTDNDDTQRSDDAQKLTGKLQGRNLDEAQKWQYEARTRMSESMGNGPCGPLDPEFGILTCDPDLGSAIPILVL